MSKIFKTGFKSFGECEMVIESKEDVEVYATLTDLIDSNESLKEYILDLIDENEEEFEIINEDVFLEFEEAIFDYFNSDNDVLTCCSRAESLEEFLTSFTTLDELKNIWIEDDSVYAFRSYQYSDNVLIARFDGFESVKDVKKYCIDNDINLSEFQGSSTSLYDFNNCYFFSW